MLDPQLVLLSFRRDLQQIVLPVLADEDARAVAVAGIGILGELANQVRWADEWCGETVREMLPASERWETQLSEESGAPRQIRRLRLKAIAASASDPVHARACLLEAAEIAVRTHWRAGPVNDGGAFIQEIRRLLAADIARQLQPLRNDHRQPS